MASSLMTQECSGSCMEDTEFALKFVVTKLELSDVGKSQGFEKILIAITFDGNVIKIEDIQEDDEGEMKPVGHELVVHSTPEKFSEKLRKCPIMFNLSRGCNELGTVKMEMSDCFADAVKCDEFGSETNTTDLKFVENGKQNASMTLIFRVSREDGNEEMKKLYQGLTKEKPKKKKKLKQVRQSAIGLDVDFPESDAGSGSGFGDGKSDDSCFSNDTDLCSAEEQSEYRPDSSSSVQFGRSKCCSDIAVSLDISNYSDKQKTFCLGCQGFSISGVTCDNKLNFLPLVVPPVGRISPCKSIHSDSTVVSTGNCKKLATRVCSECFEDLTVLPSGAPCPKCACHKQLNRKLIMCKSDKVKSKETEKIRECLKSALTEAFLDAKDRLMCDWKRLNRTPQKKVKKTRKCKKRAFHNQVNEKSFPR